MDPKYISYAYQLIVRKTGGVLNSLPKFHCAVVIEVPSLIIVCVLRVLMGTHASEIVCTCMHAFKNEDAVWICTSYEREAYYLTVKYIIRLTRTVQLITITVQ